MPLKSIFDINFTGSSSQFGARLFNVSRNPQTTLWFTVYTNVIMCGYVVHFV